MLLKDQRFEYRQNLLQNVNAVSRTHSALLLIYLTGVKRGAEVKNEWICTSTPTLCLRDVHRDNFTDSSCFWHSTDFP
jgi:hypothetical protein